MTYLCFNFRKKRGIERLFNYRFT